MGYFMPKPSLYVLFDVHQLYLCRGVRPLPTSVLLYDTKQSDGEVQFKLELWEIQSTHSFPSLPGPLWSGVVAPDRALLMGQIEQNYMLMLN